jgi:hypothetical protein
MALAAKLSINVRSLASLVWLGRYVIYRGITACIPDVSGSYTLIVRQQNTNKSPQASGALYHFSPQFRFLIRINLLLVAQSPFGPRSYFSRIASSKNDHEKPLNGHGLDSGKQ